MYILFEILFENVNTKYLLRWEEKRGKIYEVLYFLYRFSSQRVIFKYTRVSAIQSPEDRSNILIHRGSWARGCRMDSFQMLWLTSISKNAPLLHFETLQLEFLKLRFMIEEESWRQVFWRWKSIEWSAKLLWILKNFYDIVRSRFYEISRSGSEMIEVRVYESVYIEFLCDRWSQRGPGLGTNSSSDIYFNDMRFWRWLRWPMRLQGVAFQRCTICTQ